MNNTPNPSTYKQVLENMGQILELVQKMGDMSNLPMTVEQMAAKVEELSNAILTPPPEGGVVTTPEGAKVVGLHSNTTNSEINNAPDTYVQGLTLELKLVSAIGLSGMEGITKPYVFVLTFIQDTAINGESVIPDVGFSPMQLAFADSSAVQYSRIGTNNVWGEWRIQGDGAGEGTQIIQSVTEPVDQPEGHYWCEPISDT